MYYLVVVYKRQKDYFCRMKAFDRLLEQISGRRKKVERSIEMRRLRKQRRRDAVPYRYCRNCGTELQGPYCHHCGQQAWDLNNSFGSFIAEYFSNAWQLDRKILPTAWQLFRRPGFLTNEFLDGKINSYVHPLKMNMFLLVVVVAVFALTTGFHVGITDESDSVMAGKMLDAFRVYLPVAILLLSPVAALLVQICNIRRHRTYITHFVFTLHYTAFLEILILVYSGISLLVGNVSWDTDELVFFIATAYLMAAMHRVYGDRHQGKAAEGFLQHVRLWIERIAKLFCKAMFINIMYCLLFACAILVITLVFAMVNDISIFAD